jgi:hypothetical protein
VFMYFLLYIGSICVLKARESVGWAVTTETGPNEYLSLLY